MGLENPGTVDNIAREVQKDVLLSNYMFSGLRCDLQKVFSMSPLFRLQHGFAMGSQALSPWQLMALYGNSKVFMQAAYSSDNSLTAWGHLRVTPGYIAKIQTQISPSQGTMVQLDNEFVGEDFSASLKAMSPSLMEGGLTGIFIGSYLQSVTPRLAVGFEGVWQRAALNVRPETVMSYCARYKSADWVASAQYLAQGSLGGSYWRRLTDKVEAGVDCQLQFAPGMGGNGMFGGMRKEGTTTVGVKYNFLASVYRAQVDSAGKIGVVLEKRIAPPITLTFAAEIDQWKQSHKLGLAVSIESAPEDLEEAAQRAELSDQLPPPF